MARAKQTAQVVIESPERTATIRLDLGNAVRGRKNIEKLEKTARDVNGVEDANMDGPHVLLVEVAKAHTGEKKVKALAVAVLRAIGASQRGDIETART